MHAHAFLIADLRFEATDSKDVPCELERSLGLLALVGKEHDQPNVAADDRRAFAVVLLLHQQREHLGHRPGELRPVCLSNRVRAQDLSLGRRPGRCAQISLATITIAITIARTVHLMITQLN